MLPRLFFLCIAISFCQVQLHAQAVQYALPINGPNYDRPHGMTVTPEGDILFTIEAPYPIQVAGTTVPTGSTNNNAIIKLDRFSNLVWYKLMPQAVVTVYHLKTDAAGNIYMIGANNSATLLDTVSIPQAGTFLAKFDPGGNALWVQSYANVFRPQMWIRDLEVDDAGNCAIAGHYGGQVPVFVDFGGWQTTSTVLADIFVAKYAPNGNLLWGDALPGTQTELGMGVGMDGGGNVFVSGQSGQSFMTIGSTTLNWLDLLVIKYNPSGSKAWVSSVSSGNDYETGSSIVVDQQGNSYVHGMTESTTGATVGSTTGVTGLFVTKLDSSGNFHWVMHGPSTQTANIAWESEMELQGSQLGLAAAFTGSLVLGTDTLTDTGVTWGDLALIRLDTAGTLRWSEKVGSKKQDFITGLAWTGKDDLWITGYSEDSLKIGGYTLPYQAFDDGFVVQVLDSANVIAGQVFYDTNLNGQFDPAELPKVGGLVEKQPGNVILSTDHQGQFFIPAGIGNSVVSYPQVPTYYNVVPGTYSINFPTLGLTDSSSVFALQPIPNITDNCIYASSGPARPGFMTTFFLSHSNVGTEVSSGTVTVVLDSHLTLQSSLPAPNLQSGDTLVWNFSGFNPADVSDIQILCQLPASVPLQTMLHTSVDVAPALQDTTPANNTTQIEQEVVGAFDPNDKRSWPGGNIHPNDVAAGQEMRYRVRFQNTGTDTAFTVVLRDTLDPNLDFSTFKMLNASHPQIWNMGPDGQLKWTFSNILLPDSNVNEPASHGFVEYKIMALTSLQLGDSITNSASIYFDFNAPVVTNTVVNHIDFPAAIEASAIGDPLRAFPVPTNGELNLDFGEAIDGRLEVHVFDLTGAMQRHLVRQLQDQQKRLILDLKGLASGVYLLRASYQGEQHHIRIVVAR